MRYSKGFSLIELVVVLTVIGVIAGTAVVRLGSVSETTLNLEAERTHAHIKHIQNLAVSYNTALKVTLDSASQWHVSCQAGAGPAPCDLDPIRDPALRQPYSIQLPAGVSLTGVDFAFDSWGRPISTADSSLQTLPTDLVLSQGGAVITIRIEPLAGFVTIL